MNSPKNKFYVYLYLNEVGSPYYVGKGHGKRAFSKQHAVEVPPKDRIIFLKKDLTEDWAFFMEMHYIDQWGRLSDGTGILENKKDGGQGALMPPEIKAKISARMKGVKKTEEHRKAAAQGRIGVKAKKKVSQEFREKCRQKCLRQWDEHRKLNKSGNLGS